MDYNNIIIGDIVKIPNNIDCNMSSGYTAEVVGVYKNFIEVMPVGRTYRTSIAKGDVNKITLVKRDPKVEARKKYEGVLDVVESLQRHLRNNEKE